jgi:hypothetical protein
MHHPVDETVVSLDVGGIVFLPGEGQAALPCDRANRQLLMDRQGTTDLRCRLCPAAESSYFAALLGGDFVSEADEHGVIFVDRDPAPFTTLLWLMAPENAAHRPWCVVTS